MYRPFTIMGKKRHYNNNDKKRMFLCLLIHNSTKTFMFLCICNGGVKGGTTRHENLHVFVFSCKY